MDNRMTEGRVRQFTVSNGQWFSRAMGTVRMGRELQQSRFVMVRWRSQVIFVFWRVFLSVIQVIMALFGIFIRKIAVQSRSGVVFRGSVEAQAWFAQFTGRSGRWSQCAQSQLRDAFFIQVADIWAGEKGREVVGREIRRFRGFLGVGIVVRQYFGDSILVSL